jgi:hypothetical protein
MPTVLRASQKVFVRIRATNTGELRWEPACRTDWPRLYLSYHVLDAEDRVVVWDGERTEIPRIVDPGGSTTFLAMFAAPPERGTFRARWDLVSESECWFEELGSPPLEAVFTVGGPSRPHGKRALRHRLLGSRKEGKPE